MRNIKGFIKTLRNDPLFQSLLFYEMTPFGLFARYLRERHLTPYRWIVEHLHMGAVSYAQSLVSRTRKEKATKEWRVLEKQNKLD